MRKVKVGDKVMVLKNWKYRGKPYQVIYVQPNNESIIDIHIPNFGAYRLYEDEYYKVEYEVVSRLPSKGDVIIYTPTNVRQMPGLVAGKKYIVTNYIKDNINLIHVVNDDGITCQLSEDSYILVDENNIEKLNKIIELENIILRMIISEKDITKRKSLIQELTKINSI